ncbi:hypothetical protein E6W39_19745 [Kitasatospora acidiphila]|uniref:Uncharacterized protein n=1 Tax=Kitasatospora acidiphila TaxID=2567942 RepID=A0A540W4X3_9ACTN|nr:hypothetical protein [Kitasatospora acidiphila]TQF04056.1 hypothetical protein E6W39_19745 [Kitasatospora acidiphila]
MDQAPKLGRAQPGEHLDELTTLRRQHLHDQANAAAPTGLRDSLYRQRAHAIRHGRNLLGGDARHAMASPVIGHSQPHSAVRAASNCIGTFDITAGQIRQKRHQFNRLGTA